MGLWGPSGRTRGAFPPASQGRHSGAIPAAARPLAVGFRGSQVTDQPEQAVDPLISLGMLRCGDHAWHLFAGDFGGSAGRSCVTLGT